MIVTAALTAKSSAETPKKARFSDAKADLLDALMRVLYADFDALPAPKRLHPIASGCRLSAVRAPLKPLWAQMAASPRHSVVAS